ncbi:unnamed protein product, partial [marine sediment metagenome]
NDAMNVTFWNQIEPITASYRHTCGLLSNGTSMCWGHNIHGQIGDGTNGTDKLNPVFVNSTESFISITASNYHTCGLLSNGSAMCWGRNDLGQLGIGS